MYDLVKVAGRDGLKKAPVIDHTWMAMVLRNFFNTATSAAVFLSSKKLNKNIYHSISKMSFSTNSNEMF